MGVVEHRLGVQTDPHLLTPAFLHLTCSHLPSSTSPAHTCPPPPHLLSQALACPHLLIAVLTGSHCPSPADTCPLCPSPSPHTSSLAHACPCLLITVLAGPCPRLHVLPLVLVCPPLSPLPRPQWLAPSLTCPHGPHCPPGSGTLAPPAPGPGALRADCGWAGQ